MVSRTAPGFRTQLLATRKQTISRLQADRGFIIDVRAPSAQLIAHWGKSHEPTMATDLSLRGIQGQYLFPFARLSMFRPC